MFDSWVLVPPLFFVACFALLGGLLGSFVNAAVYRIPQNISLLTRTRSFCPKCNQQIDWYDNLPILSFLLLRGKCRKCQNTIPMRYLVVELIVASLMTLAAYQFFVLNHPGVRTGTQFQPFMLLFVQCVLIVDLTCATFTDLEVWIIPYQTTWYFMPVGLILAVLFPEIHISATPWTGHARWDALIDSFQGLVMGAGILWMVGFICLLVLRKEGMGGGDAHLVGMVGTMLGWKPALLTLLLGLIIGTVAGITGILWDRHQQRKLGEKWKPRNPTFELPPEEDLGPPPPWPLLVMGAVVLAFEIPLYWLCTRQSERDIFDGPAPHAPIVGIMIGSLLLVAYLVWRHWRATGRTPMGEIQVKEDGSKTEVLKGNYMPFGPSLAAGAILVAFYDPLLRGICEWWMFYHEKIPFSTYLLIPHNGMPFKMLGF